MKYTVEVRETLARLIEVEADTYAEAENEVIKAYHDCEIVLDYDDFIDVEFNDMGGRE